MTIIKTKAKTTKKYLQGLRSYHIDMGFDESAFSDPRLERIIRGGKRYYGDIDRKERFPITREILACILQQIPDTYDGLNVKAALCLGFSAFLRAGEFTYDKWEETSPNFALTRSFISFEDKGWQPCPHLSSTKTGFFPQMSSHSTPLHAAKNGSPTCPVIARRTLLDRFRAHRTPPYLQRASVLSHEIISSRQSEMLSSTQVSAQPASLVTLFEEGRQSPPSLRASHATKSKSSVGGKATPSTYTSNLKLQKYLHTPKNFTPRHSYLLPTSLASTRISCQRPWHPRGPHRLTGSIPRRSGLSKERRDPRQP